FPFATVFCFPTTDATEKSVFVFAALNAFRQLIEPMHIAATEDDVIGDERFFQLCDRKNHFAFPFFFSEPFDSGNAEKIFNDVAIAIRKIAELERKEHVFKSKRGTEPGAKSEKKHSPVVITSQCLYRGIVHDTHRFA